MHSSQQLHTIYNRYLASNPFLKEPTQLYEPADYVMNLGGKRLRPILLLMSCNLFTDEVDHALPAAHAIEVFHNFTLLHDDIMDKAPLRRGKPTVHIRYDINTAILSGDVMLIKSYEYLMQTISNAASAKLVQLFNRFAIEVCEGQQYDMNFETSTSTDIVDYLKMIELKTAALIGGAMHLGAVIGGATDEGSALIEQFGRNMGIAFQLQDDILDTFGDPVKFGKKVGGDIVQNKKTFLLLKAMELAEGDTESLLNTVMELSAAEEEKKIMAVTSIYEKLNIRQIASAMVDQYMESAIQCLNKIKIEEKRKELIKELAAELIGRQI